MSVKRDYITLTKYLDNVGKVVNSYFSNYEWVRCEISNISHVGGHYYIEVIDISENGQRTKNQTAIIYKKQEMKTIGKFKHATGQNLTKGMKVLLKLRANFTSKFSFSLIVDDIDPNFTLGEMEVKINKIRKEVAEKGFQFLNRNLYAPSHFTNIAVIAPEKAAGLADFMSEANFLSDNGVCNFDYYSATFEGDKAKDSIVNAFKEVNKKIESGIKYDTLVIIRGGGSKMSLHFLNEYILAVCVCRTKIPVFVGIGHEVDKVLLDEYANFSFDTPSKVIEYISNTVFNNYLRAVDNLNNIEYMVSNNIEKSSKNVNLSIQEINNKVDKIIVERKNRVDQIVTSIHNDCINIIEYLKNKTKNDLINIDNSSLNNINNFKTIAKNNLINIEDSTLNNINNSKQNKNSLISDILNGLDYKLLIKEKDFKQLMIDIKELSPETILKRGYSIIKSGNNLVTTVDELKNLDKITIVLNDGIINLNIK